MGADSLLQTKQIAAVLGCSKKTVYRMFKDGRLPKAFKLGDGTSPIRIAEKDLRRLRRKGR